MEWADAPRCGARRWLCLERQDLLQPHENRANHHWYALERAPVFWATQQGDGQAAAEGAGMKPQGSKHVRCAIYTRVSTDQGLEQDFNSLHAQYEASQAYIRSQAHAGWVMV